MNEQIQQALIKIIDKANSGVDASINFLGVAEKIDKMVEMLFLS